MSLFTLITLGLTVYSITGVYKVVREYKDTGWEFLKDNGKFLHLLGTCVGVLLTLYSYTLVIKGVLVK